MKRVFFTLTLPILCSICKYCLNQGKIIYAHKDLLRCQCNQLLCGVRILPQAEVNVYRGATCIIIIALFWEAASCRLLLQLWLPGLEHGLIERERKKKVNLSLPHASDRAQCYLNTSSFVHI